MGTTIKGRKPLTRCQRDVLLFVKRQNRLHGRPPSLRAICRRFGWRSHNTAADVVKALERKGYLRRLPPRPTLRIL